jgi:hypothetical protein
MITVDLPESISELPLQVDPRHRSPFRPAASHANRIQPGATVYFGFNATAPGGQNPAPELMG